MKIYLDILILTNAITTLVMIRCVSRLSHRSLRIRQEMAGAAVGGAAALIALPTSTDFISALGITLLKAAALSAVILAAFRPENVRVFVRLGSLYLMCELIFGGACMAFVGITRRQVLYIRNYVVYFDVTLVQLGVCCGAVYLIITLAETVKRRQMSAVVKYRAEFRLGGFRAEFPAFADTGNKLCDAFTGLPVMIFRSDELYNRYNLDRPEQLAMYGFRPVPYSTINGDGLICVTSRAEISVGDKGEFVRCLCCAGILPSNGKKDYAIFDPQMLEAAPHENHVILPQ